MSNIKAIEHKGDKAAVLLMDDGARVWTPEYETAEPLVGKPIPGDWTVKEGQYGPQAFPPKRGGGGPAAFRNTKEGFLLEQEGWKQKEQLVQRGLNARTAYMQIMTTMGPWGKDYTAELRERVLEHLAILDEAVFRGTMSETGSGTRISAGRDSAGDAPLVTPAGSSEPESPANPRMKPGFPPFASEGDIFKDAECDCVISPTGRTIHKAGCPFK